MRNLPFHLPGFFRLSLQALELLLERLTLLVGSLQFSPQPSGLLPRSGTPIQLFSKLGCLGLTTGDLLLKMRDLPGQTLTFQVGFLNIVLFDFEALLELCHLLSVLLGFPGNRLVFPFEGLQAGLHLAQSLLFVLQGRFTLLQLRLKFLNPGSTSKFPVLLETDNLSPKLLNLRFFLLAQVHHALQAFLFKFQLSCQLGRLVSLNGEALAGALQFGALLVSLGFQSCQATLLVFPLLGEFSGAILQFRPALLSFLKLGLFGLASGQQRLQLLSLSLETLSHTTGLVHLFLLSEFGHFSLATSQFLLGGFLGCLESKLLLSSSLFHSFPPGFFLLDSFTSCGELPVQRFHFGRQRGLQFFLLCPLTPGRLRQFLLLN